MEIRNNTPSPAFGMALKKPLRVLKQGVLVEAPESALAHFENTIYGSEKSNVLTRAIRQYKGDLQEQKYYHVEYIGKDGNPDKYEVVVMDQNNKIIKRYNQDSKFVSPSEQKLNALKEKIEKTNSKFKKKMYAFRALGIIVKDAIKSYTTSPRNLMPQPFKAAAQEASELNKAEVQRLKNVKTVSTIFDEG